jgi:transposase
MMGTKERNFQPLPKDISLEDLVPEDNFYRRLQQKLDLSFVRELVEDRYAASGRPSVDPEVFFRLQLVMFHEGIRSERELMRIVADRLSLRWFVGYDLREPLPDHSSLTRIRDRFGLSVFREFFERIVQLCVEAGLVWGEELYFDATKVDANASLDSIAPRFYVEEHLGELFTEEEPLDAQQDEERITVANEWDESLVGVLYELPSADDEELVAYNAARDDWISRDGRQRREQKGTWYRRKADFLASTTDPDSSPMKRRDSKGSHLGFYNHYVVDGGKSRIILNALVTPFEVTENAPMARPALAHQLPVEAPPKASHRGHRLWHHGEHRRCRAGRHSSLHAADRSGQSKTLFQQGGVRLRPRTEHLPMSGGRDPHTEDLQNRQKPGHLQERAGYLRVLLDESPMHRQQEWPPSAAPPRGALRRSSQELPWHLPLREGPAQTPSMGGAVVR